MSGNTNTKARAKAAKPRKKTTGSQSSKSKSSKTSRGTKRKIVDDTTTPEKVNESISESTITNHRASVAAPIPAAVNVTPATHSAADGEDLTTLGTVVDAGAQYRLLTAEKQRRVEQQTTVKQFVIRSIWPGVKFIHAPDITLAYYPAAQSPLSLCALVTRGCNLPMGTDVAKWWSSLGRYRVKKTIQDKRNSVIREIKWQFLADKREFQEAAYKFKDYFYEGRRHYAVYSHFFSKYIICAVGVTNFKNRIRGYSSDTAKNFCTPSDEALVLLALENAEDQWEDTFKKSEGKIRKMRGNEEYPEAWITDVPCKYTSHVTGSNGSDEDTTAQSTGKKKRRRNPKTQRWSTAGIQRFNEIRKQVKLDRKRHPGFLTRWLQENRTRYTTVAQQTLATEQEDPMVEADNDLHSDGDNENGDDSDVADDHRDTVQARGEVGVDSDDSDGSETESSSTSSGIPSSNPNF